MTAERGEGPTPNQFTHEPERDMYLDVPSTIDDLVHETPDEDELPYDTDDEQQEEHPIVQADNEPRPQLPLLDDEEDPSERPTAPYEVVSHVHLEEHPSVSTHATQPDVRPRYLRGRGQPGVARAVKDD